MKLGLLIAVFFLISPPVFAGEDAQTVLADYRAFAKMANRVIHEEPTLVQNSNFDQKLTLKYQRYANSQEVIPFKMIFSVAPSAVKLQQLAKAYVKYGQEISSLGGELPSYVSGHISMITDPKYAVDYGRRYGEVLKTLFSDQDGKLQEFKVFDCDYTTQPTDALWYLVHAMELIDRYGSALFEQEWVNKREELREKNKIRSPEEIRTGLESDLKFVRMSRPGERVPKEEPLGNGYAL